MYWGDWIGFLIQTSVLNAIVAIASGALFGVLIARWARYRLWLGALTGVVLPILGPLIVALAVRTSGRGSSVENSRGHALPRSRTVTAVVLGLATVLFGIALLLPLFHVSVAPGVPPILLFAHGIWVDVVIWVSIAIVVIALAVALIDERLNYAASIVALPVVALWITATTAVLLARAPVEHLARAVGALDFTVGDMLRTVGVDPDNSEIRVPVDVDLSFIGIEGAELDLSQINLADPIPTVALNPGGFWAAVLAASILVTGWIIVQVTRKPVSSRRGAPSSMVNVAAVTAPEPATPPAPQPVSAWGDVDSPSAPPTPSEDLWA